MNPLYTLRSLAFSALTLVACAAPPTPATAQSPAPSLHSAAGPYELEVLVDGASARTYDHGNETHILGQQGSRYVLRIHNRSSKRVEAVVSVDGLDVIDGSPGDFAHKRGYLVPAYGSVDIDGWRLNDREAAAFRFAAVADSYAAKTSSARNVGVIGVAVFQERKVYVAPPRVIQQVRPAPESAPADDGAGLGSAAPARGAGKGSMQPRAAEAEAAPAAPMAESRREASASADDASANSAPESKAKRSRSGLGTEFGEAVSSQIQNVQFRRATPNTPNTLLGARYNDRNGLLALGIDVDGNQDDLALRQSAQPFPVSTRHYAKPPAEWRRDF